MEQERNTKSFGYCISLHAVDWLFLAKSLSKINSDKKKYVIAVSFMSIWRLQMALCHDMTWSLNSCKCPSFQFCSIWANKLAYPNGSWMRKQSFLPKLPCGSLCLTGWKLHVATYLNTRDVLSKLEIGYRWSPIRSSNATCGSPVVWPGTLFPNSRGNKAAANIRLHNQSYETLPLLYSRWSSW